MNRDGRAAFLQVNDVHGYLEPHSDVFYESTSVRYQTAGGYSRIAHLVREARHRLGDSLIVLDGGDSLHGTRLVVASQGATAVPVLNELGFDAMTGHWEFGYGPAVLQQRLAELRHPFLALNVETKSGHPVFQPSMVKETPALRVGVIGLASNIVDKTMPPRFSDGLIFSLDPPALQQEVDRLRGSEGVDLVVLLSHLGLPQDLQLMSQVRHIGVCLSAHTHNRLERPIRAGDGLVIQSGAHGSFVGLLEVEVRSGQVVHAQHQLITVGPDLPEDPQMRDLISTLTASSRPELSERVGATEIGLDRGTVLEATMDNLLLESMREVAGTELAFSNGWRYGASIPPGPISAGDLYNIIPMDPPVSTVSLRGQEIVDMLEESLELTFSRDPYRQMGGYLKRCCGLRAYVKLENPPGQRIQAVHVGTGPLDPGRSYSAAYVTAQAVGPKYGSGRADLEIHAVGAMRAYLGRHRPARTALTGSFVLV